MNDWQLNTTFNKPWTDGKSVGVGCETGGMALETLCEALAWWKCRSKTRCSTRRVSVMINPQGKVVKVNFN